MSENTMNQKRLRILHIEDEVDFKTIFSHAFEHTFELVNLNIGDFRTEIGAGEVAVQIKTYIVSKAGQLDGVVLDSDLSSYGNGLSKETLLAVFKSLGVPTCRYSKRQALSQRESLKNFLELTVAGTASILIPHDLIDSLNTEPQELLRWLMSIFVGFKNIESYATENALGLAGLQQATVLSNLMKAPSLELDFMGYSNPGFVPSIDIEHSDSGAVSARIYATHLGYWLHNYILAFPSPILNLAALAALAGVESGSLDEAGKSQLTDYFESSKYDGPFSATEPWFFKHLVNQQLFEFDDPVIERLKGTFNSLYPDENGREGVYCFVEKKSITVEESINLSNIVPNGARDVCRISKPLYDKYSPWLNL
jgi:hypothetical protein